MTQPLATARLDLEPVRVDHAREAWPSLDDERMWRYFPELRPASYAELRARYERWERGSPHDSEVWLNWLVRDRAGGALVGSVQATILPETRTALVAYATFPQWQGQGFAREAVAALIEAICAMYRLERVVAEMDIRNAASYRLAESLGFARAEKRANQERGTQEYVYELRRARTG